MWASNRRTNAWTTVFPVQKAPESTRQFIQEVLGYKWVTNFGDTSGKADAAGNAPFRLPVVTYNRSWSPAVYRVENPDGIEPASAKAKALLRYNGTKITAATAFEGNGYRCVAFGFPLETSPQLPEILSATFRYLER